MKLLLRKMRLPFSNVTGHRNRRSPQLTNQPVNLIPRKQLGCPINLRHQIHPLAPSNQVPIRLAHTKDRRISSMVSAVTSDHKAKSPLKKRSTKYRNRSGEPRTGEQTTAEN